MQIRYSAVVLLVSAAVVCSSSAQTLVNNDVRVLHTARTDGIKLDGVLDEADWAKVEPATDFVAFRPIEGAPASQRTEARVLYGSNAIYVGAMMFDTEPDRIRRGLSRRDEGGDSDSFLAAFDSYNDRKTAYLFGVTAAGVQFDAIVTNSGDDDSWDAVWSSAVRSTPEGWAVEMSIPYSQLRFSEGETTWGLEFQREIRRTGEEVFWAPITSDQANSGLVQLFGRLEGVKNVTPRRAMQITPYTLARANTFEDLDKPGSTGSEYAGEFGGDFRLGLSSNVTLDATINPDFGQVEADPAELNLTTFETFFPERRPFFLEGTQIFDFSYGSGDGSLLYTRRVGGDAPVIGASKISGRLPSGTSFGILGAATGGDFEPGRWYGAARVKQEFGNQNYIGGALTGFSFSPRTGSPESGNPSIRTVAGGADWDMRVGPDASLKFEGSLAGSIRTVDDPTLTNQTNRGYALYVGLDKVKGFFTPGSGFRVYSPDFEINDVGRFRQTDLIQGRLGGNQLWNEGNAFGPFIRVETGGFFDQTWTYTDRINRGAAFHVFSSARFLNFWEVGLFGGLSAVGGFDVRETRGLGLFRNIRNGGFEFDVETDERKRLAANPGINLWFGEDGQTWVGGSFEVQWNASDRVELSSEVEYGVSDNVTAWTANEGFVRTSDGLFIGTETTSPDGLQESELVTLNAADPDDLLAGIPAYESALIIPNATGYYLPVFGSRDTRTFGLSSRANVIFTPKLSVQFYGQLFAARGRFSDFSLLANPDELRPFDYPKRPDFAFESLQANVVLRWEYRPGSTLFLVWTQSRNLSEAERLLVGSGSQPPSPFARSTGDQLRDTFSVFPDNAFLIKLNYLILR